MADLLVKLYELPSNAENIERLKKENILIKRALSPDKHIVLDFIRKNFGEGWASECDAAFANLPVSCFIAVKDKKVVGFACYEATCKGFFGPIGVHDSMRGYGVGKVLLIECLQAMYNEGYGYAIIGGGTGVADFYINTVGATIIEGSSPGIYSRMVKSD